MRWPQKLIINHADGYRDVYDLAEDPHERDSLASEARALVADLCRHQQTGDESDRTPVTPNQDILERLRSLGYLGGSATTTSFLEDRQYPCYSDVGWGAFVHVRWADSVDAALRTTLEQSLGLVRADHRGRRRGDIGCLIRRQTDSARSSPTRWSRTRTASTGRRWNWMHADINAEGSLKMTITRANIVATRCPRLPPSSSSAADRI